MTSQIVVTLVANCRYFFCRPFPPSPFGFRRLKSPCACTFKFCKDASKSANLPSLREGAGLALGDLHEVIEPILQFPAVFFWHLWFSAAKFLGICKNRWFSAKVCVWGSVSSLSAVPSATALWKEGKVRKQDRPGQTQQGRLYQLATFVELRPPCVAVTAVSQRISVGAR